MLVLGRKVGEKIVIDGKITISLERVSRDRARIGIVAPPEIKVVREEVLERDAKGGSSKIA